MEARIPRKDMKKKRFRLSTEVRATLQKKYDRWTPVRAFERISKELVLLNSLCKMLLSFFKDGDVQEGDDVLCDG